MFGIIVKILPFVFFGIPLLFVFGLFVSGAFTLFFTSETDRGRDVIARALTYFLIILTVFLVFIIVSYLVQQGAVFNPEEEGEEFPRAPMGAFPDAPSFVVVEDYPFSGPWPLSEVDMQSDTRIFGVFCKKDSKYDIIDLGINYSYRGRPISSSSNYPCWQEQCQGSENIYIGFYWTSPDVSYADRESSNKLKKDIDFICVPNI